MRVRVVVPVVVFCALMAATPAFAGPHLSKAQNRMVSNLVERWVTDVVERRPNPVVRRRYLADGWKIAGAAERGGIPHKAWLSGNELPVLQMRVRNNPRTSWYATWKSGNEIGLVVQLVAGRGENKKMYAGNTTLQRRHGRWYVYGFYTEGTIRYGRGHAGSCVSAKCKVTGINDFKPGGPIGGGLGSGDARIGGSLRIALLAGIAGLPFVLLLACGLVAFVRSRQARRARLAYMSSRAS